MRDLLDRLPARARAFLPEASSVLNAATASGSTVPQAFSKSATSRRISMRKVEASALLSSMEMILARRPWQRASGEKLAW